MHCSFKTHLINRYICFSVFVCSFITIRSSCQDTLAMARVQWQRTINVTAKLSAGSRKIIVVKPGQSIEKAVRRAAAGGVGTVMLAAGIHRVNRPLLVPSSTVLQGVHRDSTRLHVYIKAPFAAHESGKRTGAVVFKKVSNAGLENLTIQYKAASFEPNDKDSLNAAWDRNVFHGRECRDTMLFVDLVLIDSSEKIWVKNCRLLWAGNDPIHMTASQFITCSKNYIDRAYNKSDRGQGYYNIIRSKHILVDGDTVRRIRHFTIHRGSQYIVVRNSFFEVDINFHNGDAGYNLIEGNTVRIPSWHSWNAISRGDPRQHQPPGPWNLLYNNYFCNKDGRVVASGKGIAYLVNDRWEGGVIRPVGIAIPATESLY